MGCVGEATADFGLITAAARPPPWDEGEQGESPKPTLAAMRVRALRAHR